MSRYFITILSDFANVASFVFGIASGLLTWYFTGAIDTSAIIGLIFTIVFDRIAQVIDSKKKHNAIEEEFFDIKILLTSQKDQIISLSHQAALNRIAKKILLANKVLNTNVNIGNIYSQQLTASNEYFNGTYIKFLMKSKHNVWHDIIGVSELFSDRYRLICNHDYAGQLKITILRRSFAIVNFTIIYTENDAEIYFGWLSDEKANSGVFYSKSQPLIDIFASYFRIIEERYSWYGGARRQISITNKSPISKQTDIVNKRGRWITSLKEHGKDISFGIVDIDFPHGSIEIRVTIYDKNCYVIHHDTHDKNRVTHFRNQIYFTYEESTRDGYISGICYYEFSNDGHRDVLNGFTTRDQDAIKRVLKGSKIEASPKTDSLSPDEVKLILSNNRWYLE